LKKCRSCARRARRDDDGLCKACAEKPVAPIRRGMPIHLISAERLDWSVWPLDVDEALDELKLSRPLHMA